MHEFDLAAALLRTVLQTAGPRRVAEVHVRVGEYASVVEENVANYFGLQSPGTVAEGALLVFRRETARGACQACSHQWDAGLPVGPCCPSCGSGDIRVQGGMQVRVESIEVEDEDSGG